MLDRRDTQEKAQTHTTKDGKFFEYDPSHIDRRGNVQIRNLTLKPSDLWTPEFRDFYVRSMAREDALDFHWPVPVRGAPAADWDKFDAWLDERYNSALVSAALRCYPAAVSETVVGGVRVGIVSPSGGDSHLEKQRRVLINLHGGGFFYNRGLAAGQLESIPVAATSQTTVVTLDYRQAPFFRHPAGSEDVEAVYTRLLEHHKPESIGIYGCSAGAALASQAVARFASRGIPRPGAVGLFSMAPPPPFGLVAPWGDGWGDSGVWFAGAPKNQPSPAERVLCEMMQWYMEGLPLSDTTAYPGNSNDVLAAFPATLFLSGTRDFASSTVIAAHARFLKLGVDASLYLMEGAPHAAHVYGIGTPEAHEAHRYVARWFDQHLA